MLRLISCGLCQPEQQDLEPDPSLLDEPVAESSPRVSRFDDESSESSTPLQNLASSPVRVEDPGMFYHVMIAINVNRSDSFECAAQARAALSDILSTLPSSTERCFLLSRMYH